MGFEMEKFYAVFDIDPIGDDFVIAGVFTNEADAMAYTEGRRVKVIQYLQMNVILDILLQDRLQLAADKIAKLIG